MCQNISCRHLLTVTLEKPLTKCLTQVFNSTYRSNSLLKCKTQNFLGEPYAGTRQDPSFSK